MAARGQKSHGVLARHIVELLREQGLPEGAHVREQWLADHFSISRSPVRAALGLLADQGLLKAASNQGFFLCRSTDNLDAGLQRLAPSDQERLQDAILRDRLARRLGEEITVGQIMRRYAAKRPTVTAVLNAMAKDRLVERAPGQKWLFAPTLGSPEAYEESYRFRLLIEPAALLEPEFEIAPRRFARHRRELEQLVAVDIADLDAQRIADADAAFHETLAECSGNRYLTAAVRQQNQLRCLENRAFSGNFFRLRESCQEHLAILDEIEAGRLAAAAELMREHIARAQRLRPSFANRGAPPLARFAQPAL